jgi:hypothetical protein
MICALYLVLHWAKQNIHKDKNVQCVKYSKIEMTCGIVHGNTLLSGFFVVVSLIEQIETGWPMRGLTSS